MSNFSISGFPLVDSDGDVVVRSITTDIVRFSFLGIGAEASKSYTYGGGLLGPGNFAYNQHNIEIFRRFFAIIIFVLSNIIFQDFINYKIFIILISSIYVVENIPILFKLLSKNR